MSSFMKAASRPSPDVRAFLREAASGNGIKYAAEKGAKHVIYVPYTSRTVIDESTGNEVVTKELVALSANVHEWSTSDGKFKAVVCLKDVVRTDENGEVLNDGKCPFCDRVSDAWNIYKYRKELEEANCKLTGQQREKHLETTLGVFRDERKAKEPRTYMYLLAVKFKTDANGKEVLGEDGLPVYELKVMKLSSSRIEKLQQQIVNSGTELPGSELIFEYPNEDDRRLVVSKSTTVPVFPNNMITTRYPAIKAKIENDVNKFDWEGVAKAFPEMAGMTTREAETTMADMFNQWDAYEKERQTNPNAKYLEYVVATPTATPDLSGATAPAPILPNVPNIPIPGATQTEAQAPTQAPNIPIPGVTTDVPNVNDVFAGAGAAAPKINI